MDKVLCCLRQVPSFSVWHPGERLRCVTQLQVALRRQGRNHGNETVSPDAPESGSNHRLLHLAQLSFARLFQESVQGCLNLAGQFSPLNSERHCRIDSCSKIVSAREG